jgi:hypothetical protein
MNHSTRWSNVFAAARRLTFVAVAMCCLLTSAFAARLDEGMWTFDNIPLKLLKEKYGFTPTKEWLDHVRMSSVRFNDGGSGSFVSANGLVMTNHHVARGQLQKLSTKERDIIANGYYARTQAEELKFTDVELNVLMSMEEVTARVLGAGKPDMKPADIVKAQRAEIAAIEKESTDKTGLRSDVVELYRGGEYWLYRYKRYTDVRLVYAPESQIAFYGGDPDNFTYPRFDLDITLVRVYENDKPVKTEHYLKWNNAGAVEDELVFVSGHPGSTNRLNTYAQFEFNRDHFYPARLKRFQKIIDIYRSYTARGKEEERRAISEIFSLENAKKASTGEYNGLLDKAIAEKARKAEEDLRAKVAANPEWQKLYGGAWANVETTIAKEKMMLNNAIVTSLVGIPKTLGKAFGLLQYAANAAKPAAEQMPTTQLEGLKAQTLSAAPVYPDMDEALFAGLLGYALSELGADHPIVKTILAGRTPEKAAKDLVSGTKLADAATRKTLWDGKNKTIDASQDSMLVLARKLDPLIKAMNATFAQEVTSQRTPALQQIARARFAVYGKNAYPDATFTLRLSFGTVKGYPMNGTIAPYKTTMYGLYDRALSFDNKGDFALPQRFWERKGKVNLATPVNFVTTCDIIGGNSGSPLVNKNGEVVGLIFDSNIEALCGRFVVNEVAGRSVCVHPAFITESLRTVYDAPTLADELEGKTK